MNMVIYGRIQTIVLFAVTLNICWATNFFSSVELQALQDLFVSTHGAEWTWMESSATNGYPWNFSLPDPNPCNPEHRWQGLGCNNPCTTNPCSITFVSLGEFNLRGTIPDSIGNLTDVETFAAPSNSLTGTLPATLGNMKNLSSLYMDFNKLTGSIPDTFGAFSKLELLLLYYNFLTGRIPDSFGQLQSMNLFFIYDNLLTGPIPSSLGRLSKCSFMYMDGNLLSGSIPDELGDLSQINYLHVTQNRLTGTLPTGLGRLKTLLSFDAQQNQLSGPISEDTFQPADQTALVDLQLQDNRLSQRIPESLTSLPALNSLLMHSNYLTGPLPISFGNATLLRTLDLQSNLLSGALHSTWSAPDSCRLHDVVTFVLSSNVLSGSLCFLTQCLRAVNYLELDDNRFNGSVALVSWNQLSSLISLDLSANRLSGSLSAEVESLSSLRLFNLSHNRFHGLIPASYTTLAAVQNIDLSSNALSGPLPATLDRLKHCLTLNVAQNMLSGPLPTSVGDMTLLGFLDVSQNQLTGTLPASLGQLRNLQYLYLYSNRFSGALDAEVFGGGALRSLVLTQNCFEGVLPGDALCSNRNLSSLYLDGLSASSHCPGGVVVEDLLRPARRVVRGSLPSCLLALPQLQTLQVAANSLSGPIALPTTVADADGAVSDAFVSRSLQRLGLSSNRLSGAIPSELLGHGFLYLDLSFNRLAGSLEHYDASSCNASNTSSNTSSVSGRRGSARGGALSPEDVFEEVFDGEASGVGGGVGGKSIADESDVATTTLYVQVNRLSGSLPASVRALTKVNVLEGNLFGCSSSFASLFLPQHSRRDLPTQDPAQRSYVCGSQSTDAAFVCLALVLALVITLYLARHLSHYCCHFLGGVRGGGGLCSELYGELCLFVLWLCWNNTCDSTLDTCDPPNTLAVNAAEKMQSVSARQRYLRLHCPHTFDLLQDTRHLLLLLLLLSGLCLLCLLPLYLALSLAHGTYESQYIWALSAGYLQGSVASYVLVTAFLGLVVVVSAFLLRAQTAHEGRAQTNQLDQVDQTNQMDQMDQTKETKEMKRSSAQGSASGNERGSDPQTAPARYLRHLLALSFDALVVLAVNGTFVYLHTQQQQAERQEAVVSILDTLCLALFKLLWQAYMVTGHGRFTLRRLFGLRWSATELLALTLFNNVCAPYIAAACVDPRCFLYAGLLDAPPRVSATVEAVKCMTSDTCLDVANCTVIVCTSSNTASSATASSTTSLLQLRPPFHYSFQCAGALLSTFSGVFVLRGALQLLQRLCLAPLMRLRQRLCLRRLLLVWRETDSDATQSKSKGPLEKEQREVWASFLWSTQRLSPLERVVTIAEVRELCREVWFATDLAPEPSEAHGHLKDADSYRDSAIDIHRDASNQDIVGAGIKSNMIGTRWRGGEGSASALRRPLLSDSPTTPLPFHASPSSTYTLMSSEPMHASAESSSMTSTVSPNMSSKVSSHLSWATKQQTRLLTAVSCTHDALLEELQQEPGAFLQRLQVSLMAEAALVVSFGVLFPPLACVLMLQVLMEAYALQRHLLRLVPLPDNLGDRDTQLLEAIETESRRTTLRTDTSADIAIRRGPREDGQSDPLRPRSVLQRLAKTLWTVTAFACVFFWCFVLFDTSAGGPQRQGHAAEVVALVVVLGLSPVWMLVLMRAIVKHLPSSFASCFSYKTHQITHNSNSNTSPTITSDAHVEAQDDTKDEETGLLSKPRQTDEDDADDSAWMQLRRSSLFIES